MTKKKSALLTLSILMSLTAPVYASGDVATSEEAVRTPDVVVTATRTEALVKNVPNAVEVITSKDIEDLGATDIYSALRLATNVDVSKIGAGHRFMIRGMNASALILVDGRRVSNEYASMTRGAFDLDKINLSNVERIEIVRGSASAQYGADAMNGVINIITKKSDKQSVTIGAATSTDMMNNYYRFDFGKQGKLSAVFDANFAKYRKRDFVAGTGSTYYGPRTNYDFAATYELSDKDKLDFNIGYYKEDSRKNTIMMGKGSLTNYDKTNYDYGITYSGKGDKSDYLFRVYYNKYVKEEYKGSKNISYKENTFDTLGVEAKNTVQVADNHLLTYGGEYRKIGVEGPVLALANSNSKDDTAWAGYIQDEWMAGENLLLIPAVRYDHDENFGGKVTPKIGATYFLSDDSRIKANWGKGWRAPNLVELYTGTDSHSATMIKGNPDLKPEESTTWELAFEAEKNNNWTKVNYFHTDYDNMISYSGKVLGPFQYQFDNVPGATVKGVEFEVGRKFNDNWSLSLMSNWLDGKNSSDEDLQNTSDNVSTIELSYDDNNPNGYSAKLWNQWVSNYHYSDEDYDYNTVNFVVNKKFAFDDGRTGRVFAGVDNIGDKKIGDIYLDGRFWRVGAEITF